MILLVTLDVQLLIHGGKQKLVELIVPQPGAIDLKPGSATKPFYGIKPVIVDETGKVLMGHAKEDFVWSLLGQVR